MRSYFRNDGEGRLRAFWRVLLYFALWRAVTPLLDAILSPFFERGVRLVYAGAPAWTARGLHFGIALLAAVIVTWAVCHYVDHRTVRSLGLRVDGAWWLELAIGLVLGVLLMALLFAMERALGWVQVVDWLVVRPEGVPFGLAMLALAAVFIAIGVIEELVFRGYVLRNCAEGMAGPAQGAGSAVLAAWVISSVLFGLFHVLNPNSSWVSTLNLTLGGMMLGLPMILTGRLAMPIGLHITWNFAQANLFGYPVSGYDFRSATVLATESTGPALWTGGAFGPEAGLLGLFVIALGCGLILAWARLREGSVRLHRALTVPPATIGDSQ